MTRYVVAAVHGWNRAVFEERIAPLPGEWTYIDRREDLSASRLRAIDPRYVFFLHWSWKVPLEIIRDFECVAFHMTDLPYGRGGSPLQNLILRGRRSTVLTAFRMDRQFDAGPVYMKRDLALDGSAQEIYARAARLAAEMIADLIASPVEPVPQTGEPTVFKRRRPEESEIPRLDSLEALYDFIRMLDADGYPRAFLASGGFRWSFSKARLDGARLIAEVEVTGTAGEPE